jgi:acyl dehydratase
MAHGMFIGSLITPLLGTYFSISNNILHSISLDFRNPVFSGDKIIVEGEVIKIDEIFNTLKIKIQVYNTENIFVKGKALIKII